jgi:hypothetical protein
MSSRKEWMTISSRSDFQAITHHISPPLVAKLMMWVISLDWMVTQSRYRHIHAIQLASYPSLQALNR